MAFGIFDFFDRSINTDVYVDKYQCVPFAFAFLFTFVLTLTCACVPDANLEQKEILNKPSGQSSQRILIKPSGGTYLAVRGGLIGPSGVDDYCVL